MLEIFRQEITRILEPHKESLTKEDVIKEQISPQQESKLIPNQDNWEAQDFFSVLEEKDEREKRRAVRDLNFY